MKDQADEAPLPAEVMEALERDGALVDDQELRLRRVMVALAELLDAERVGLYLHDPRLNRAWLKASSDHGNLDLPLRRSVVGEVIVTGRPVMVPDMSARDGIHKDVALVTGFQILNCLCVPVVGDSGRQVVGAIEAVNKVGGSFAPSDQRLLLRVVPHLRAVVNKWYVDQYHRHGAGLRRDPVSGFVRWIKRRVGNSA